jgi:transposase
MGVYRLSKRQVTGLLEDCFDIHLSTGSVINQQTAVSAALAEPVEEARADVQEQAVRNIDETGWYQRDQDQKGWLWVVVTPLVTVFVVALSRGGKIAKQLLGEDSGGLVGSDRYSAYNWLPLEQRQLCWAHLLRDFQKIVERGGQSALIGQPLRLLAEEILTLWGRVRDGTLAMDEFLLRLPAFQQAVHHYLAEGASCSHPKTAKTCCLILKVEAALWIFASHPAIEPTNNSAERALRKAVIWRGISYGTQSDAGSRFVERILTVVETCRQQERNPLDYLRRAVLAHRQALSVPSLLPDTQVVFSTP